MRFLNDTLHDASSTDDPSRTDDDLLPLTGLGDLPTNKPEGSDFRKGDSTKEHDEDGLPASCASKGSFRLCSFLVRRFLREAERGASC